MFLTCRNVILTLQEKKLDVDAGYLKRLLAWSSSIPAAEIGERTHQGPDRVGGGGNFYSASFSRKCNLNRQPLP